MIILTKEEFNKDKGEYIRKITAGAVFVYPTDTIYGIGCNAKLTRAVKRVREIKERETNPFSVIVPSKKWITNNCITNEKTEEWTSRLPGAYTLILALKNNKAISPEVNNGMNSLGVRIPDHWISEIVRELNIPIITTSANITGQNFMIGLDNLDERISTKVDFIIYEGEKAGRPSTLVNLSKEETEIVKR